jgi:hypothetical protein
VDVIGHELRPEREIGHRVKNRIHRKLTEPQGG